MAIDRARKDDEPDLEEVLGDLEKRVERLKILYEQYFMGIEKIEPQTARKEVTRKMLELTQMNMRNTALRYRFNALNQKWGVYITYWNRTLRAIENGTYFRNVVRAGRDAARRGLDVPDEVLRAMPERMRKKILKDREHLASRSPGKAASKAAPAPPAPARAPAPAPAPAAAAGPPVAHDRMFDGGVDAEFDQLWGNLAGDKPAAKSTPPPLPPPPPPPRPRPQATPTPSPSSSPLLPPGMDEKAAQDLFRRYVHAKKLVGDKTDSLQYEQVLSSLARQAPRIMEQAGAKGVEFSVVIKDGKVILKATPKK